MNKSIWKIKNQLPILYPIRLLMNKLTKLLKIYNAKFAIKNAKINTTLFNAHNVSLKFACFVKPDYRHAIVHSANSVIQCLKIILIRIKIKLINKYNKKNINNNMNK